MLKRCQCVTRLLMNGLLMFVACSSLAQQPYPSKPIRLIVPYPPGGSTTPVVRLVGQKLTESWGQPVIIDNRPGGNTLIGAEALAKSPQDGYAICVVTTSHVTVPSLLASIPFDPIKDFAPVATLVSTEFILVVHPSVPANNLRDFIALAKSKPGQLNYATSATGSMTQLGIELFSMMAGIKMQHIPYKGAGPATTDLIAGQVQLTFQSPGLAVPHIKSGRLKAIAISGEARSPALPQLPTFTEAGLPGIDVRYWMGILAPAGTPKRVIDKLSTEIARIMTMPDVKEKLVSQGTDPFVSTPEQFAALMKADMARFAKVIKAASIKIDD